jgi:hypothetical protein
MRQKSSNIYLFGGVDEVGVFNVVTIKENERVCKGKIIELSHFSLLK